MTNRVYDVLKWLTLIGFPAIITFAGVVMNTLNYEYTNIVLTISTAFVAMMGTMLGISNYNYNKENEKK